MLNRVLDPAEDIKMDKTNIPPVLRSVTTGYYPLDKHNQDSGTPSYTVGGNVNWCSLYGKQYGLSEN